MLEELSTTKLLASVLLEKVTEDIIRLLSKLQ